MVQPLSHTQAAQIVKEEWRKIWDREPSKLETLYMLAVAWLETHYGRIGQHLQFAERGLYNWANIEKPQNADGTCPPGWEPGKDWDIQKTKVCFRVFQSDNEAANALIRNLTKRHWPVIDAIQLDGSPEAVAHAMKRGFDGNYGTNGAYYTAPENIYAQSIRNAIAAINQGLIQENPNLILPNQTQKTDDNLFALFAGITIIGGIGYVARTSVQHIYQRVKKEA